LVGSVHRTPAYRSTFRGGVSAQVPEVRGTLKRNSPRGNNPCCTTLRMQMEIHPSPHSRDGHFRRRSCGHYDHLPVDPIGPATFKDLHPPRIRRCLERDSIAVGPNLFTPRVLQAIGPSTRRNRKQNQNPQDCHETSIIPMCEPKRKGSISRFFAEEATSQAPPHDSGTTAMRTRLQVPAGVPLVAPNWSRLR